MKHSTSSATTKLEYDVAGLERLVDPLFQAGRYRDFFARAHAVREVLKTSRLTTDARTRLWDRLNRCVDSAKARQEREFAARNAANLARWREQVTVAERYTDALTDEINQLRARTGPPAEAALWQRRIAEKQARLTDVRVTIASLRHKIDDVSRRLTR